MSDEEKDQYREKLDNWKKASSAPKHPGTKAVTRDIAATSACLQGIVSVLHHI